ncbi:hypothetical protein [Pirellulimonas nuda]|nr:hypothetical protein [Pirellulimonas nuda]
MPPELSGEPDPIPVSGVEQDDINAPAILVVGAVSVLLTIAAILGTAVLYYYAKGAETAKFDVVDYQDARDAVLKQDQQIARWDGDGAKYVIPIDVAMQLVIAELQTDGGNQAAGSSAKQGQNEAQTPAETPAETADDTSAGGDSVGGSSAGSGSAEQDNAKS